MNPPSDFFLPGVRGGLYQVVAPDGRAVANFLPHRVALIILHELQTQYPGVLFAFQQVPDDQIGGAA
ncbi:hypothetical protein [Burkholderia pyrrocinia]|uniref:hypothetical protein n=1 Tax=Burkholderia pyrrocinia TaxID=60550 RepID=UPI00158D6439|nr:hypothetical protein [Burkholderia pyrrocinia]